MRTNRLKKWGKRLLLGTAVLVLVGAGTNSAWTLSGSNTWELEIDRDGIQVYSFKAPGTFNKQFKGVARGDYTRSQIAASLLLDNDSLENCKEWIPVCVDLTVLEPYSEEAQGDSVLWTLELLPPVFKNREYVIKSHAAQDPETGIVTIDVMAGGAKVPLNDCCIRITHIHNRWQLTPVENGQLEIVLVQDFSMGGFFPDFLVNLGGAEETFKLFSEQLPTLVDKPKYRNARFSFINEAQGMTEATAAATPVIR
ncbi:hypothetical protein [Aquimonas sp.]|jgi:hypothetical protein|uniref:hypothetical protein n=1 Tax=Aquimonas sp. TaxID=1872588 RepID=UPI0037C17DE3